MAPRGRRKKAGLMREDAARDAMRAYGFEEGVIKVCIKELLQLYGNTGWFLIEEFSYSVLLNKCLEKQGEQENNVAEEEEEMAEQQNEEMAQEEQNEEMAREEEEEEEKEEMAQEQNEEMAQEEEEPMALEEEEEQMAQEEEEEEEPMAQEEEEEPMALEEEEKPMAQEEEEEPMAQEEEEEQEQEQEQQVEDERDNVGSNSTSLVGCGAEAGTQTCQADASPVAAQSSNSTHRSVGGARSSGCGWLSDEEETDPGEDSENEMIQLTPEPLCEELQELLNEVHGEKKRKRPMHEMSSFNYHH
ncbi:unnamed protein product [Eruca vesicaria subsp. sativa]|uniref:WIYLD domain-containing protein n=1 Tax=Eruca vesicaria subsp. sativa TaxID=29727 RepID=A0ABC8M2Z3_ERUVS|nr:unnamed protein product [Eruca vesicaria subsp. sativa]